MLAAGSVLVKSGLRKVNLKLRGHDKIKLSWSLQEMMVEEDSIKKGGQTCGLS